MNKTQLEEMNELRDIIKSAIGLNVLEPARKRVNVEARVIFTKLMRDRGCLLHDIGFYLKKDHTTVMHYLAMFDTLIEVDGQFRKSFIKCSNKFMVDKDYSHKVDKDKIKQANIIEMMNNQLEELTLKYQNLYESTKKFERLKDIISLIDQRTPKGKEDKIKSKINQMFNGLSNL